MEDRNVGLGGIEKNKGADDNKLTRKRMYMGKNENNARIEHLRVHAQRNKN